MQGLLAALLYGEAPGAVGDALHRLKALVLCHIDADAVAAGLGGSTRKGAAVAVQVADAQVHPLGEGEQRGTLGLTVIGEAPLLGENKVLRIRGPAAHFHGAAGAGTGGGTGGDGGCAGGQGAYLALLVHGEDLFFIAAPDNVADIRPRRLRRHGEQLAFAQGQLHAAGHADGAGRGMLPLGIQGHAAVSVLAQTAGAAAVSIFDLALRAEAPPGKDQVPVPETAFCQVEGYSVAALLAGHAAAAAVGVVIDGIVVKLIVGRQGLIKGHRVLRADLFSVVIPIGESIAVLFGNGQAAQRVAGGEHLIGIVQLAALGVKVYPAGKGKLQLPVRPDADAEIGHVALEAVLEHFRIGRRVFGEGVFVSVFDA